MEVNIGSFFSKTGPWSPAPEVARAGAGAAGPGPGVSSSRLAALRTGESLGLNRGGAGTSAWCVEGSLPGPNPRERFLGRMTGRKRDVLATGCVPFGFIATFLPVGGVGGEWGEAPAGGGEEWGRGRVGAGLLEEEDLRGWSP